jgi:4-amino-4-deoxy-L-arabinose transferase-like glycosyltransferase
MTKSITLKNILSSDFTFPVLIALLQLTIQILAHGSYGYFRDELYYIACSDHLDFGYVDEPPLSIAILSISRWAFGDSLQAIRLLPSIAGVGVVLLAAAMARRMGGGRFAMGIASLSVAGAGALISKGGDFSMNAFDVFFLDGRSIYCSQDPDRGYAQAVACVRFGRWTRIA